MLLTEADMYNGFVLVLLSLVTEMAPSGDVDDKMHRINRAGNEAYTVWYERQRPNSDHGRDNFHRPSSPQ